MSAARRSELYGELGTKAAFKRYLRRTKSGKLRVDKAAIAREAHLDGKFLLRTDDESLSAADIALGYKSLYEAERGWRDMKRSTVNIRPVYHRREDRIRAHVQQRRRVFPRLARDDRSPGSARHHPGKPCSPGDWWPDC